MNQPLHPERKTERLHLGRISAAGARYFVTLVTKARKPWLASPEFARRTIEALRAWHEKGDGRILAATIMPDHVHVLFELGEKLGVGACVGYWKSHVLKVVGYAEDWQRDFWEHRVRDDERWEDYGLYIFLNPYRALNRARWVLAVVVGARTEDVFFHAGAGFTGGASVGMDQLAGRAVCRP
jgi:REP element-mobilizing transposase RayT